MALVVTVKDTKLGSIQAPAEPEFFQPVILLFQISDPDGEVGICAAEILLQNLEAHFQQI